MISSRWILPCVEAFLVCLFATAGPAFAGEYHLRPQGLPIPLVGDGKVNTIIEASGVEPIGDGRTLLIAHDKAPALHIVETATGRLLGGPITSPKFPAQTKTGPKWEGMALDSDGNYYIIGAHSGKTDEERSEKAVLLRFRLKDADAPAIDDASVVRWDISRALPAAMKTAGVEDAKIAKRKIEGLAIRESKGENGSTTKELVIGLREPGDQVRAFSADVSREPSPGAELEMKPLFAFQAEPREGVPAQLTSMEYVPDLKGFLVVTATEDEDNAFHGNTLWFIGDGVKDRAVNIATFEVAMKAEGLTVLKSTKEGSKVSVKLLITYDNDPHATKIPSRMQMATLSVEN